MAEEYLTVKLTLTQLDQVKPEQIAKARYRSRIEQSPLGASSGPGCDFKIDAKDWAAINSFVARMSAKSIGEAEVRDLGQKLFSMVFGKGEVFAKYQRCLGRLKDGVKLRLALAIQAENLAGIPWEYMNNGYDFLLQKDHSIVRVADELPERRAPFGPIGRLLVAVANPGRDNPDEADFVPFDDRAHVEKLVERLDNTGIDYKILNPCTRQALRDEITGGSFDALYFAGHGIFTPNVEGQLILEDGKNGVDPLKAALLAQWLSNPDDDKTAHKIRFVYLNSCSTAKNTSANTPAATQNGSFNPFAGVAQRLMRDGQVEAVVAMQTDVEQTAAFDMAAAFFEELKLRKGRSPEEAMLLARFEGGGSHSWGVPVIYSYLSGPEDFVKNRLAYFLSAQPGRSKYGLFLPSFVFGVPTEEAPATLELNPPQSYSYKGDTLALEDMESGLDVIRLLAQLVPPDELQLWRAVDQQEADCTHWFLFGSRSNKIVQKVLGNKEDYSPRFDFDFKPAEQPGKWVLRDTKYNPPLAYSIDAPNKGEKGEYREKDDIGVIEKIVSTKLGFVFFLLSGLGDRATRGCGWYLYKNWDSLLREFGNGPFGIILRFPGGFRFNAAERLDKGAGE